MHEVIAKLIPFLIMVESGGDCNAIGDNGKAAGCLQIHKCVVDDVNRFAHTHYDYRSRLNPQDSIDICTAYLYHYGRRYSLETGELVTPEVLARIWNGGPSGWKKKGTIKYWHKVEKLMRKSK